MQQYIEDEITTEKFLVWSQCRTKLHDITTACYSEASQENYNDFEYDLLQLAADHIKYLRQVFVEEHKPSDRPSKLLVKTHDGSDLEVQDIAKECLDTSRSLVDDIYVQRLLTQCALYITFLRVRLLDLYDEENSK